VWLLAPSVAICLPLSLSSSSHTIDGDSDTQGGEMAMNLTQSRTPQVVYWLLTGALLGLGAISLSTVGWTLLPLTLGLAVYGILQFGPRRTWALVLGAGAAPALVLAFDIASPAPLCPISGPVVVPLVAICGNPARGYRALIVTALVFVAIALFGLALGLLFERWARSRPNVSPPSRPHNHDQPLVPPMRLVVLAATIVLLITLPAYGPAVLAMLGMIEPPLFLAFPLVVVAMSLLHGWRGWLGMLAGYVALQVLLILFIGEIRLLVPPQCGPGPCLSMGPDPLVGAGYPGPIFFFGAIAGLPAVLLHAIVRYWPFGSRPALA